MRIVSPWKDRAAYVSIMLSTLKEAMRGHDDVYVSMYDNQSVQMLPPIADDFGKKLGRVDLPTSDCHHNFINMFNREFDMCDDDYIVNIDSDCCVHPEFIIAAKKLIHDLPDFGHASLYSEGNHPEPTELIDGIYHVRPHISMTASIIRRDAWADFPKPKPGEDIRFGCIDGAFSTFVAEHKLFECYSTRRSYVEHIGAVGAYASQDAGGVSQAHRARRFDWR